LEIKGTPVPVASPLKSSLSNVEIASLVGGVHAPEIIRIIKSGESLSSREIVAGVVGAISGYNLGKWLGAATRPACGSEQILRLVQTKPEFARDLGKVLVRRELNRFWIVEVGNPSALVIKANLASIRRAAG